MALFRKLVINLQMKSLSFDNSRPFMIKFIGYQLSHEMSPKVETICIKFSMFRMLNHLMYDVNTQYMYHFLKEIEG